MPSIDRAAELVSIEDVVEPEAGAAAVYADLLPTFASLYDALAPAFRALGPSADCSLGGPDADCP